MKGVGLGGLGGGRSPPASPVSRERQHRLDQGGGAIGDWPGALAGGGGRDPGHELPRVGRILGKNLYPNQTRPPAHI